MNPQQQAKPQPIAKRHHFVPEMVLKRFTVDGETIHLLSKRDIKPAIRKSRISNAFVVGHGYSKTDSDGSKSVEQENRFSDLEGKWSPALDACISAAQAGNMSAVQNQRDTIIEFFYFQWIRTPEFVRQLEGYNNFAPMLEAYVKAWVDEFRPLTETEVKALLGPGAAERMRQNTIVDSFDKPMGPELATALAQCRIDFVTLSNDQGPFIIGSQPVITVERPRSQLLLTTHHRIDIWLPVASRAALKLVPYSSGLGAATATDREVQSVNGVMASQCETIGGESPTVLEEILAKLDAEQRLSALFPGSG